MRLVALVSSFDESPHWISTCVSGLARFCDLIIFHDGAYQMYPGARPCSHPQQAEAAILAAEAGGAGCVVYRPNAIYKDNEVGKRSEGLRLAGAFLEPDVDWLIVCDVDYHILKCDPELIRARLEATTHDVATYTLLDGKDFLTDEKLHQYVNTHECDHDWTARTRDLYRWNPTLKIGPAHWTYSAIVEGERQWLRGPWERQTPCLDLNSDLVFYHRTQDRSMLRQRSAKGYYDLRNEHRTEWMEQYDPPIDDDNVDPGLVALG